ncbi:hypothetical protein CTAYLR_010226 [Chrysophaeum taylorii]|uniref:NADH dehydrogenase [ubiquinone] 1 alpha subcomplex assembly factor 3 n=1 Tax=Chrysophaeum taylorii TaxID=2483200 RepID=A0AAD7U5M2_9STRA|nr:hypothetical protein CTAYLR_010226 [Chrysophaeum taylorii]
MGAADLGGEERRMQVTEYDVGGFELQSDVYVPSSIVLLSKSAYLWRPRRIEDITPESLRIFTVLHPRPEIVFLGLGAASRRLSPEITKGLEEEGISVEQMDTGNAVHTFNILNEEMREIGAALLTPEPREEYRDPFEI